MISRYRRLAQLVTDRTNANEHDGVLWVKMVLDKLELPHLGKFGVCQTSFEQVADDASCPLLLKEILFRSIKTDWSISYVKCAIVAGNAWKKASFMLVQLKFLNHTQISLVSTID